MDIHWISCLQPRETDMATETTTHPTCNACDGAAIRWGKDASGNQRWRCKPCKRTWSDLPARPLGTMRLPVDRAVLVLSLLVEGSSIRSAERVTGHHRDTIMRLLALVGGKCEALLDRLMHNVELKDVQADEIWTFCKMKQKTKNRLGVTDPEAGDAYTFIAIDRDTKLIPAWTLGKRDTLTTDGLRRAAGTGGRGPVPTDHGRLQRLPGVGRLPPGNADRLRDAGQGVRDRGDRGRAAVQPAADNRHGDHDRSRPAGPGPDLHVARRAAEPHGPHEHAALHQVDQRLLQEVGEPPGRGGAPLRALQPVPDALGDQDDAGDEGGRDERYLGAGRCSSRLSGSYL